MTSTFTSAAAPGDGARVSRAEHKVRTSRAIQAAALELFLERGYDDTTIDEIAERAGVSARTFYRYFPVKEDVLEFVPSCIVDVLAGTFAPRAARGRIASALRVVVLGLANSFEAERDLLFARAAVIEATPSVARRLQSNHSAIAGDAVVSVERLLESHGHNVDSLQLQQLFAGFNAALAIAMQRWCSERGAVPLPELWSETVDLFAPSFDALFEDR